MTRYFLTKEQIETGIKLCIKKVYDLLDDVEILCNNNGNEATAVPIYTVAIEEYGKSLLLKKCLENGPQKDGNYQIIKNIFGIRVPGKGTHSEKFDEAIADLPEECLAYQKIDVSSGVKHLPPKHKEHGEKLLKDVRKISEQMPYVDFGAFYTLPFDFEIRKNLLYVDWDDENKIWKPTLEIEPYRYERTRKFGYVFDEKSGSYMRRTENSLEITSYPYDEEEIELSEDETYPGILLNAIESFRQHLKDAYG